MLYTFRWTARWGAHGERYYSREIRGLDITDAFNEYRHQMRNRMSRLYSIKDEAGVEHYDSERKVVRLYQRLRFTDLCVLAARAGAKAQTVGRGEVRRDVRSGSKLKAFVDLGEGRYASPFDVEQAAEKWLQPTDSYLTFEQCLEAAQKYPKGGLYRDSGTYEIVRDTSDGNTTVGVTSLDTAMALLEHAAVGPNCYGGFKKRAIYPFETAGDPDAKASVPLWRQYDQGAARLGRAFGVPAPFAGAMLPLETVLKAGQ